MGEGLKRQIFTGLAKVNKDGQVVSDPLASASDPTAGGAGDKGFLGRVLGVVQTVNKDGQAILPPSSGGGGATGAATSDHFVITAADADLTAATIIPGLAGSPNIKGTGGNDEEWDQNTAGVPAGWTAFNAPTTTDTNTFKSHFHMISTTNSRLEGIYKAAPASPFTVILNISDSTLTEQVAQYQQVGISVFDAVPTGNNVAIWSGLIVTAQETHFLTQKYVNNAFSAAGVDVKNFRSGAKFYLKLVVESGTDISSYFSSNGMVWLPIDLNRNFGLGVVTHVGPTMVGQTTPPEAFYDWIRFK